MSERAKALADRLAAANDEAISMVEQIPAQSWHNKTASEDWSVAATAHHVAASHAGLSSVVKTLAAGTVLPPFDMNQLHDGNAKHAADFAGVSRDQVLTELRDNGNAAVAIVRDLTDAQLDITSNAFGAPMTVQAIIENVLIGHVINHMGSVRQAAAV